MAQPTSSRSAARTAAQAYKPSDCIAKSAPVNGVLRTNFSSAASTSARRASIMSNTHATASPNGAAARSSSPRSSARL